MMNTNFGENWDRRFLQMAGFVSTWSKDPSTKCGAVVVNSHRRMIGAGYNGFPVNVADSAERLNDRDLKMDMVVHAEPNALMGVRLGEAHALYVTRKPCAQCASLIASHRIRYVVYCRHQEFEDRWSRSLKVTDMIFSESGTVLIGWKPEWLDGE